jgi:hypothetical protein
MVSILEFIETGKLGLISYKVEVNPGIQELDGGKWEIVPAFLIQRNTKILSLMAIFHR